MVGSDETVALTAFVVIALHHGLAVFQDTNAELKQRVVRAPACLPFAGPRLPLFFLRNLGVQLTDLPPHLLLGNFHLKRKLIFGDESNCRAPGCPRSCHHSLRTDACLLYTSDAADDPRVV